MPASCWTWIPAARDDASRRPVRRQLISAVTPSRCSLGNCLGISARAQTFRLCYVVNDRYRRLEGDSVDTVQSIPQSQSDIEAEDRHLRWKVKSRLAELRDVEARKDFEG